MLKELEAKIKKGIDDIQFKVKEDNINKLDVQNDREKVEQQPKEDIDFTT